jgi:hypothetical protein
MEENEMKIVRTETKETTLENLIMEIENKWRLPLYFNFEELAGRLRVIIPPNERNKKVKVKMVCKVGEREEDDFVSIIIRWIIEGFIPQLMGLRITYDIHETINGFVIQEKFRNPMEVLWKLNQS